MKLVYIEWEDACSQNGWHTKDELEDFIKDDGCWVKQVGWIYKETKTQLILAGRLGVGIFDGEPEAYGHLQKIPKTWIRKRKDLTKWIKERRKK